MLYRQSHNYCYAVCHYAKNCLVMMRAILLTVVNSYAGCHFAEYSYADCHFVQCWYAKSPWLNVIMLSVVML